MGKHMCSLGKNQHVDPYLEPHRDDHIGTDPAIGHDHERVLLAAGHEGTKFDVHRLPLAVVRLRCLLCTTRGTEGQKMLLLQVDRRRAFPQGNDACP